MANHVTFEERRILYRLKKKGKSNTEIAELRGRHRSTICRELSRNTGQRGYHPKQAQHLAEERRLASRRPHKMDDPDVREYVEQKLEKRGSPEKKIQYQKRIECSSDGTTIVASADCAPNSLTS